MSTTDEIIANIAVKGSFPDDSYFTNAQMLTILNDEMKLTVSPLVMKLNEDYFIKDQDYTISTGTSYKLPSRILGGKIRDIKLVDSSGGYTNLNRLFEEDRATNLTGYYLSRNSITLSPNITTGTLRVTYFLRPSDLVLTASVAQILSIDSTTQVTVSSLPSTFTLSTPIDFIQSNDILDINITIQGISGTSLTFTSIPTGLAVGDYICLAGQSPVPLIPEDLHPILIQAALVVCLSSKKDKSASFEIEKLERMKLSMVEMLDPRVESNDTKARGQGILSLFRRR